MSNGISMERVEEIIDRYEEWTWSFTVTTGARPQAPKQATVSRVKYVGLTQEGEVEDVTEPKGDGVYLKKSGCHGFCEMGPLVQIF